MDAPSYTTDFMKRIAFLNGQVLHDFHLNTMQKNIAEAIKLKTTRERYDFYLLVSPYNMYFHEPLVNEVNKAPTSTAKLDTLSFSFSSGAWETTLLSLPAMTKEICLVSNFEDDQLKGASVNFYYRTDTTSNWEVIIPDQPIYLSVPKKYIQLKAECIYTGTIRPTVYDFALLWK